MAKCRCRLIIIAVVVANVPRRSSSSIIMHSMASLLLLASFSLHYVMKVHHVHVTVQCDTLIKTTCRVWYTQ